MTLEEAKEILTKEGFKLEKVDYECTSIGAFTEYESPTVVEAMEIVQKACYSIGMLFDEFDARKARLKKEFEENTKAPGGGSPALQESAKQFNDALLDEQSKKIFNQSREIDELKKRCEALDNLSASRNKIIVKQSKKISKLRKKVHDKDAVLADVAEELRLSKIREEKLTEVCQKYLKEIDEQKDLVDDISLKYDGAKYNLHRRIEECEKLKKQLSDMTKLLEDVRNGSKEYVDYGIEAEKMIQKMAKVIVNKENMSPKDFCEYYELANGKRFNPRIPTPEISQEELMKLQIKAMNSINQKPIEDDVMEGCKEMLRLNIKLMRELFDE